MTNSLKRILALTLSVTTIATCFISSSTVSEAKKKSTTGSKNNIVVVLDAGHDSTHLGCHTDGFEEGIANLYIAYYCKQELEKYSGVTVYMTRYGFECPYGLTEDKTADCLTNRVNFAKSVNADVLVSLHNDYDPDLDTSQNGAKVIVLPELCITGYTCEDLFWQDALLDAAQRGLYAFAEQTSALDALLSPGILRVKIIDDGDKQLVFSDIICI